jgi:hypothetical protein
MPPDFRTMPELWVRRGDLAACELVDVQPDEPADGEAQLRVERFALSVNNVTYAKFGDELRYWSVFPASGDWGRIPASCWQGGSTPPSVTSS